MLFTIYPDSLSMTTICQKFFVWKWNFYLPSCRKVRVFFNRDDDVLNASLFSLFGFAKKTLFFSVYYFDNWIFASLQKKKYQHIDHFLALFSFVTKQENVFR